MDQPLLVKARSVYALFYIKVYFRFLIFGYRVGIHFAGEAFKVGTMRVSSSGPTCLNDHELYPVDQLRGSIRFV